MECNYCKETEDVRKYKTVIIWREKEKIPACEFCRNQIDRMSNK